MAAASHRFQIAISGPTDTVFPSFPSDELAGGNVRAITLSNIRSRCNISTKLFFTTDGKTRLDDKTTLEYYMTLTVDGQKILKPDTAPVAALVPAPGPDPVPAGVPDPVPAPAPSLVPVPVAPAPVTAPGIPTFHVKVTDSTPVASSPLALPVENATMTKLLEQAGKATFLTRGTLPTFSNTELAALTQSYAATVGTGKYPEPAELKEVEWDAVMRNTRAFHGYYLDHEKGILRKAPKPAFRLRGIPKPGTPAKGTADDPVRGPHPLERVSADCERYTVSTIKKRNYNPPIPPFYINDTATVNVFEINDQTNKVLIKEGFNSRALGGSIGLPKIPISVSAAFDEEHSWVKQTKDTTSVDSLAVTYNFPRVVVELDSEYLELTPECALDARNLTDQSGVDRFTRRYGNTFATSFTLGGYLFSTRSVSKTEQADLEQVKDRTRKAAGLSIQSPMFSGSFGVASASGKGSEEGGATLHQEARLTWDAHGGDTLLASNPTAWVGTVKDPRLWRLMDQQRVVQLFHLIKEVDLFAYKNLISPSSGSQTGKDPVLDKEYSDKIRVYIIEESLNRPEHSELLRRMEEYYRTNQYDASPALEEFNGFMAANYPDSQPGLIKPNIKWHALSMSQRAYFGVFMASKGQLPL
ncbi:hypothetical protein PFICI_10685 [Pestalotiopsis fici W106-1]|uniref:MACPF-like domain-containing protein n=1 Tax=Pestalotiopsis fici (strain W106-1 / CGMCC3.15140) TaxID=1229662 RepID=W3WXN4_PESFW|nr:uncharacterized protein PFICI_10685 [Pestalotiopsis fici W106-1]ETS78623.1 hypothetical protein PFICI_10685 [Pestalotiopsis fici W106-1]